MDNFQSFLLAIPELKKAQKFYVLKSIGYQSQS